MLPTTPLSPCLSTRTHPRRDHGRLARHLARHRLIRTGGSQAAVGAREASERRDGCKTKTMLMNGGEVHVRRVLSPPHTQSVLRTIACGAGTSAGATSLSSSSAVALIGASGAEGAPSG